MSTSLFHRPGPWTVDDLADLPDDGNRYETVHGELLVTPAPGAPHQRAVKNLVLRLGPYVEASDRWDLWFAPADIRCRSDTTDR